MHAKSDKMRFLLALLGLAPDANRARLVANDSSADDHWAATVIKPRPRRRAGRGTGCAALFAMGEEMRRGAVRQQQVLGILVLKLSDLREVRSVFGRAAAEDAVDAVLTQLSRLASAHAGVAVRTSIDAFAVLVPGSSGPEVHRALQMRLGQACSIDFEQDGEELLLVPDVHARTIGESESVQDAYCAACRAIESERQLEDDRCDFLRRERESHSIPAELAAMTPRQPSTE